MRNPKLSVRLVLCGGELSSGFRKNITDLHLLTLFKKLRPFEAMRHLQCPNGHNWPKRARAFLAADSVKSASIQVFFMAGSPLSFK